MSEKSPRFRRIMLKLSGEALMGDDSFGIAPSVLEQVASEVASVHNLGIEVGLIIGGGNIFSGLQAESYGVGRVAADHMGMLATIINSLALSEALQNAGCESRIMTAIDMIKIAEPYVRKRALRHLEKSRIVIVGGGTGNPYFTTDTAAALRAMEIGADVLLKATRVDGVYDSDPEKNPSAVPFDEMIYSDLLQKNLKVMDLTAVSLAMGQNLPIIVFNLLKNGNFKKLMLGENIGTLIKGDLS